MPKFESNIEGPATPNNRPYQYLKETCGKHREINRGRSYDQIWHSKCRARSLTPKPIRTFNQKPTSKNWGKYGLAHVKICPPPKQPPSHDTGNTHDPKIPPLENKTTKIGGKTCPMDQDGSTTCPINTNSQLGQDSTTPLYQNKTTEIGAIPCQKLNPMCKVQTRPSADQNYPEKILVGNTEINRGTAIPKFVTEKSEYAPHPPKHSGS